ncbi:MAG TPA: hypothetical protein VJ464_04390 [Blastocatellia bacterium]|nr:hypothetical protein [Blastocatellia bacterium]
MTLANFSLWTDTARTRFFLIPDDKQFPLGDFVLRTLTGREMEVDPTALAEYEISEQEAKGWLKGEFGKMLDGARAVADRFIEKLRQGPPGPAEDKKTEDKKMTDTKESGDS